MNIHFVRHAESCGNATEDYSTDAHDALSDAGLAQAEELAMRLHPAHFDAVYCSPLRRAVQTILPYAQARSLQVEIWPELAEACWQMDRSVHEHDEPRFATGHNLAGLDTTLLHFRENRPLAPAKDETYSEGIVRLRKGIRLLSDRHQGTDHNILIVSHGYANARLIELLLGMDPIGRFDHANTGMSLLVEDNGMFAARYINRLRLEC